MFRPVPASVRFPELELEIGRFWKEHTIYEKSLDARDGGPRFVFYEGPPTANGLPHPAHCLTRAIKDLFPRYRTMRGYSCLRKAGWDTHGLPVEVEVSKELGIHSKEEIERYGVEPFIHKCIESVFRYTREWERMTERVGFWIHLDDAYVTYHQSYVESVWWALKSLFDRGLFTRVTRSSGGGPREGRRSARAKSARAIAKWPTRACTFAFRWSTSRTRPCWSGPPRPGRCPATSLPRCIRSWNTRSSRKRRARKLIVASALVEAVAAKAKQELKVLSTCTGAVAGRAALSAAV